MTRCHEGRAPCRPRDRGSVDLSIEMLFGLLLVLGVCFSLFEAVTYWHARNVFDDAAAEGVRVAAAYDGTCEEGIATARRELAQRAGSWASEVEISCTDGPTVMLRISGGTPGVIGDAIGFTADVIELAPKER